jgi:hypothetical protein
VRHPYLSVNLIRPALAASSSGLYDPFRREFSSDIAGS